MSKDNKERIARIALAMIVKDDSEAEIFRRCLGSFSPVVDGIFVTITGPSGKHEKIHKIVSEFGGKSQSVSIKSDPNIYKEVDGKIVFANFAEARNVSFDFVEGDYDWVLWADVDDVLNGALELRKVAQDALDKDLGAVHCTYWYAVRLNNSGNIEQVLIEHQRERLVRKDKFKWISRIHEVCVPKDNYNPKYSKYLYNPAEGKKLVWIHLSDEGRISTNIDRNKQLLMWEIEDTKWRDPRPMFYLAKVYFDNASALFADKKPQEAGREDDKAIELLTKYLELSGWEEERANALEYMGLIHVRNGRITKAIDIFHAGIREYPNLHLNYLRLSDCYYKIGHKKKADFWLDVAAKLPAPSSETMGDTIGNSYEIKLLTATLFLNKAKLENDLEGVKKWATVRATLMGADDGILEDVQTLEALNFAVTGVFNLSKWLKDNGYENSVEPILNALPPVLKEQQAVSAIANNILPPKKWDKGSIVYFASFGAPHFETWSAKSLERGIGGSETAVIRLSEEWVKMGKDVTVFCDCGEEEGMHNGVKYKNWTLFNWNDEYDTLILWRSPHLLDREIKAKRLFMDLHDVISAVDWTPERVSAVDKIFVKSKMHREYLPKVSDDKFVVISNGIDL